MPDSVPLLRTEIGVLAGLGLHGWDRQPAPPPSRSATAAPRTTYTRPLGVLEAKFDMASRYEGLSDIFLQFDVEIPDQRAREVFFARLVPAWSTVRARHPLLASTIHTEAERVDALPGGRVLRYAPPERVEDALEDARRTILVGERSTMASVLAKNVLNGPRVLLEQDSCLARVLIFSDAACPTPPSMGFLLAIAHVASPPANNLKLDYLHRVCLRYLTGSPSLLWRMSCSNYSPSQHCQLRQAHPSCALSPTSSRTPPPNFLPGAIRMKLSRSGLPSHPPATSPCPYRSPPRASTSPVCPARITRPRQIRRQEA